MNPASTILTDLQRLSGLPHLEPAAIAKSLGRRPQLMDEDGDRLVYLLVEGRPEPWGRVEARWLKERTVGMVQLELRVSVAVEEIAKIYQEKYASQIIAPDPRNPHPKQCVAFQVPVGELKLVSSDGILEKVGLSEVPVLVWKKR